MGIYMVPRYILKSQNINDKKIKCINSITLLPKYILNHNNIKMTRNKNAWDEMIIILNEHKMKLHNK